MRPLNRVCYATCTRYCHRDGAPAARDLGFEFFLKNRHLLGFDTPSKGLVTAVRETVDNALDACEEEGSSPISGCR